MGAVASIFVNMALFDTMVITVCLLYFLNRKHEYIRVRGWEFSACLLFMSLLHYHVLIVNQYFNITGSLLPCAVAAWSVILFIPLFFLTFLLRSAHIVFQYHLQLEKSQLKPGYFARHRIFSSLRVNFGVYMVCTVLTVIIAASVMYTNPLSFDYGTAADCIVNLVPLNLAQFSLVIFLLLLAVVLTWKVEDAFYIMTELKLALGFCSVLLIIWMTNRYTTFLPFPNTYVVYTTIWCGILCNFAFPVVMTLVDRHRAERRLRRKSTTITTLSDSDKLRKVLKDPSLFKQFKSMCVRAWCVENLLFYQHIVDYKEGFPASTPQARKDTSWMIYNKFIAPGSDLEVNLDMTCRETIHQALLAGNWTEEVFDEACEVITEMLKFGVFKDFSSTPEFLARFPEVPIPKGPNPSTLEVGPNACAPQEEVLEVPSQST